MNDHRWPLNFTLSLLLATQAFSCSCDKSTETAKGHHAGKTNAIPILTTKVSPQDVKITRQLIGSVVEGLTVNIQPQVSGKLIQVHVKEGQNVKKGDLLFTIDPRPYLFAVKKCQASIASDQGALQYAKKVVASYEEIRKQDFVSQINFEEYQQQATIAKATLDIDLEACESAKFDLENCFIHAPIDGRIGLINVDIGNIVNSSSSIALTTLRQISTLYIDMQLIQNDFVQLQEQGNMQQPFEVSLDHAKKNPLMQGYITFVDNQFSTQTGTILLRGKMDNAEQLLWPGEFVRVHLQLKILKQAITVPLVAMQRNQAGDFVYVVKEDLTAELRPVTVSDKTQEYAIITGGLQLDEKVVIDGQVNLYPGAHILIKDSHV